MSAPGRGSPAQSATADREIVIFRVIDAPRELVFEAFTEVRHLSRWWGPEGFSTTTWSFEFRVGGGVGLRDARAGRDGLRRVDHLDRDHPSGADRVAARGVPQRPERLRLGPDVEPDGVATRVELHTVFPTRSSATRPSRSTTAIEGGRQTLSNLAAYVTEIVRTGAGG